MFEFSAGEFVISSGAFENGLKDNAMRDLNVPSGCTAILFNDSTLNGTNCTLQGPVFFPSAVAKDSCFNNMGVSSVRVINDPSYGNTVNATVVGVVEPPPSERPGLVPAECWADFLLDVRVPASGGVRTDLALAGGQTPSNGNGTTNGDVKGRSEEFLSARVDAVAYGQSGNNPGAFLPLDGLFLAVGRGGEQATVVVLNSTRCAGFTSKVAMKEAMIRNMSADGLRLTVELPSYDAVCSSPNGAGAFKGCGVSQPISLKGTQRMKNAPAGIGVKWAVDDVVSWSCPPSCPLGMATRSAVMAKNQTSQLHPTNTVALRNDVGGIMYVRRCTGKEGNASTRVTDLATSLSSSSSSSSSTSPSPSTSPPLSPSPMSSSSSPSPVRRRLAAPTPSVAVTSSDASDSCQKALDGIIPFVTDPRSCLDPARAHAAPCAYGEGATCKCCSENARCPGGARTWPRPGFWVLRRDK